MVDFAIELIERLRLCSTERERHLPQSEGGDLLAQLVDPWPQHRLRAKSEA